MRNDCPTLKHLLHKLAVNHPIMTMETFTAEMFGDDRLSSKVKAMYGKCNPVDDRAHFRENDLPRLINVLNSYAPPGKLDTHGGCAIVHYLAHCAGMVATRTDEQPPQRLEPRSDAAIGDMMGVFAELMKSFLDCMGQMLSLLQNQDFSSDGARERLLSQGYLIKAGLLKLERAMGAANKKH
jgi:hypothetical protein